jgi:prephenate dehydratase
VKSKVAIQGIAGSNHHQVALDYYGKQIELIECLSFDELIAALLSKKADRAVMAIENSIAGSIIPNYALVYQHQIAITGEHYQSIRHHLMVGKGQSLSDVTEVHSHPMALLQCKEFLGAYPRLKLVEAADTALVAQQIAEKQVKGVAAIAPPMAAELYGLEVLNEDIQTLQNNATRFIALEINGQENNGLDKALINKASLRFITDHKRGSLATVLNVMSDCDLNLTKIQSLPVIETPWKYAFFVDVTFDQYVHFEKAHALLTIMTEQFQVLGEYKNALAE